MQGVTTSLTFTFVVILGIGFAILNLSQHIHNFVLIPHTLVQ